MKDQVNPSVKQEEITHNLSRDGGLKFRFSNLLNRLTPKNYILKTYKDRSIEILPGIKADDPNVVRRKLKLARLLNDIWPVRSYDDGTCENGVHENFYRIIAVPGYAMEKVAIPLLDNKARRKDLAEKFINDRHAKIFTELCAESMGYIEDSVPLLEGKSTGPPLQLTKASDRYDYYLNIINHIDFVLRKIRAVVRKKDNQSLCDLANDYGIMRASFTVFRTQPDSVRDEDGKLKVKDRPYNDVLYALTNGKKGISGIAERSLFDDQGFRMRRRIAYGGSPNVLFIFFRGMQKYLIHKYDRTYHIKQPDDLHKPIDAGYRYVRGFDINNMDLSLPFFFFEAIASTIKEFVIEEIVDFWLECLQAPILLSGITTDMKDNGWMLDPLDIKQHVFCGNRSGIASTSWTNKIVGTFVGLAMLDDYYGDVLGNVDKILRHEHPRYAIVNNGDDLLIYTTEKGFFDNLQKKSRMSDYFDVRFEDVAVFGGKVLLRDPQRFVSSLNSFFKNRFAPENDWRDHRRGIYFDFALEAVPVVYGDNPCIQDALKLLSDFIKQSIGRTYDQLFNELRKENRYVRAAIGLPDPSMNGIIDAMIMLEPSRLSWQYFSSEVSESIIKSLGVTIPAEVVNKYVRKITQFEV